MAQWLCLLQQQPRAVNDAGRCRDVAQRVAAVQPPVKHAPVDRVQGE